MRNACVVFGVVVMRTYWYRRSRYKTTFVQLSPICNVGQITGSSHANFYCQHYSFQPSHQSSAFRHDPWSPKMTECVKSTAEASVFGPETHTSSGRLTTQVSGYTLCSIQSFKQAQNFSSTILPFSRDFVCLSPEVPQNDLSRGEI